MQDSNLLSQLLLAARFLRSSLWMELLEVSCPESSLHEHEELLEELLEGGA